MIIPMTAIQVNNTMQLQNLQFLKNCRPPPPIYFNPDPTIKKKTN